MYLAVCEDDKHDLDAVCSLLDAWTAEHGTAVRRKTFQSAAEMLKAARSSCGYTALTSQICFR